MLDFKSRLPQTKEEKRQYKKIKNNWENVYHKKSRKRIKITTLISIAFIIGTLILCALPFKHLVIQPNFVESNSGIKISEIEMITELQQNKKMIGIKTSEYLQKTFFIDSLIFDWQKNAYEDLIEYQAIQYKYHEETISNIISEIEIMENISISELSPLKPYQTYTIDYYNKTKEFFQTIDQNKVFDSNQYNSFVKWRTENKAPFDYLIELLETNNFDFTIDETSERRKITYKYTENSIN